MGNEFACIALICSVLRFMRTGKAERRPEKSRESSKGLAKADSNYGGIVELLNLGESPAA
jgi:hypothetical protein